MRSLILHWTAGDYETPYRAYHYCIALREGLPALVACSDVRANQRDVTVPGAPYAAHTSGRNSFAIGLAVCAMAGATPSDFGRFPLRDDLLDAACAAAARICVTHAIPIDARCVFTHAEAAACDGYFGCGADERWDIARLVPSAAVLHPDEARVTGDALRRRIAAKQGDAGR